MKEKSKDINIKGREGIFDAIGDTISIQDTDFTVLYQNQSSKNLIGDHVGEYCFKAYEKRHSVCEDCPVEMAFRDGEVHTAERAVHAGNGTLYVEITASPLRDAQGENLAGIEIVRDITERKKIEEQLRLMESQLHTAINSLPFDFFVIGKDGRYVLQNEICKKRWGDVAGKRTEELSIDKRILDLWLENNRRAFSGETVKSEVVLNVQGNEGHYYNIISPIWDKNEVTGILGINIDITERKKAESKLKEKLEELSTFYHVSINRDVMMKKLKEENEQLKSELSKYKK